MIQFMHTLARLPVQGFLACTLGPMLTLGCVGFRMAIRRIADGWH